MKTSNKVKTFYIILILVSAILIAKVSTTYQNSLKPELEINSLIFSPFKPSTGTIETIKLEVKNSGKTPANNFEVCLKDNGNTVNKVIIKSLAPGKKTTVIFDYEFSCPGEHILNVKIDCKNSVKESNKRNNTLTMRFDVAKSTEKALVYKTKLGDSWFSTQHGGSSPVIVNGRIYLGGKNRYFFCIDKNNGNIIWKFEVEDAGIYPGIYTTPAFYEDYVYFGATGSNVIETLGHIYSLNAKTGKERWHFETDADVSAVNIYNGKLFALDRTGTLYCINAIKGNLIKKVKTEGMNDILCATMSIKNNRLYIKTECFHFIYLSAFDANDLHKLWFTKIKKSPSDISDSLIAVNGLLYVNGKYCIDSRSGKIIWINKTSSGLSVLDKYLFVLTKDGELYKIDLTNGSIIWKEIIESSTAPLYAKNNILIIGTTSGNVYLINERYGEIIEKFKTNSTITVKPYLYEDFVYIVSEDGYLYCFKK